MCVSLYYVKWRLWKIALLGSFSLSFTPMGPPPGNSSLTFTVTSWSASLSYVYSSLITIFWVGKFRNSFLRGLLLMPYELFDWCRLTICRCFKRSQVSELYASNLWASWKLSWEKTVLRSSDITRLVTRKEKLRIIFAVKVHSPRLIKSFFRKVVLKSLLGSTYFCSS